MLQVGITGGIGSGKTFIAGVFSALGVPVYNADVESKNILNTNDGIKAQLIKIFGAPIYKDGFINRALLSDLIFSSPLWLQKLNAIVHPIVIAHYNHWLSHFADKKYILKESALLFEANSFKNLDFIIGVWSDLSIRVERIKKREGMEEDKIYKIIAQQIPQAEKMQKCDVQIENNYNTFILPQILQINEYLLNLAAQKEKKNAI